MTNLDTSKEHLMERAGALWGTISSPIETVSNKPGEKGSRVKVRLALEGPGMWGLTDWVDNKSWSGIFHHCVISARYTAFLAEEMANKGYDVNSQSVLDGMIVSHPGRRQWDEAHWYPDVVTNAKDKQSITNETLGLGLIKGKVPPKVFELVSALAHTDDEFPGKPGYNPSLEYQISSYVDHRTTDHYLPLGVRMSGILLGNFYTGVQDSDLNETITFAVENIITRQRDYRLGKTGGREVSLDEADNIVELLGASPNSSRLTRRALMGLILEDADTEALLVNVGIDPDINAQEIPMPEWEDFLRHEYVNAARKSIFENYSGETISRNFGNWWESYAQKILAGSAVK